MADRRFAAPWTFDEANHACFIVRDGNRFPVAMSTSTGSPVDVQRRVS
jgi:hypothetical protein